MDDPAWLETHSAQLPGALLASDALLTLTRKGTHHFVILAEPLGAVTLQAFVKGREAASLRGCGAYVVGPSSEHEDGGQYRQVGERIPVLGAADTARLVSLFAKARENAPGSGESGVGEVWVNPALVDAVARALGAKLGRPLRFSRKGTAPFHNPWRRDRRESAFFSRTTGCVHDSATGLVFTLKQLCAELGINPRDYGGLRADSYAGRPGNAVDREAGSRKDVPGVSKAEIAPHSRARLIESGLTATARLLDQVRDLVGWTFLRLEAISRMPGVSARAVDRALKQGVDAGYLARAEHGAYRLTETGAAYCQENEPLADETAYQGHPAVYRRAALVAVALRARAEAPGADQHTSAAQLAERAGVSRRTVYRYARALGVTLQPVTVRTAVPETAEGWEALQGVRGWHIDMISRKTGATVRHLPGAHDADSLYELWQEITYLSWRYRAFPVLATRAPSIWLLPGEGVRDFLTPGARLEGRYVVVDRFRASTHTTQPYARARESTVEMAA